MDDDSDGIVKIEHVNKVIELLGRDNVNLSTKQVKNIIDLLGNNFCKLFVIILNQSSKAMGCQSVWVSVCLFF